MQRIGDFWIPDIDAAPGRNLERSRFGFEQRAGVQIDHLERALEFVPGRAVAIDGGANVGAWTRLMAKHFAAVHSFEPNPDVFRCLERNVREWHADAVVTVYQKGISDRREFVSIGTKEGARTVTGRVTGPGEIECITLDSLNLADCSLLKLDLEGYELRALKGAEATMDRYHPWVLIENKPSLAERLTGGSPAERFLRKKGYRLVERIGRDGIDWLFRPAT